MSVPFYTFISFAFHISYVQRFFLSPNLVVIGEYIH